VTGFQASGFSENVNSLVYRLCLHLERRPFGQKLKFPHGLDHLGDLLILEFCLGELLGRRFWIQGSRLQIPHHRALRFDQRDKLKSFLW
jgi:hypothetical protein